jgi:hypothetical protein
MSDSEKSIKQKEQLTAYASDSKESEAKEWKVVHNMNDKQAAMYESFIQDRAMQRAKNNEQDLAAKDTFLELGSR